MILDTLIKNYLESIDNLTGDEYLLRAMSYAKTWIPPEKRDSIKIVSILSQYTNREEISIKNCEQLCKEIEM